MAKRNKESLTSVPGYLWFVPQIICIIIGLAGSVGLEIIQHRDYLFLLSSVSFVILGLGCVGLCVRKFYPVADLDIIYVIERLKSFWIIFILALFLSLICVFLPNTAWPLVGAFVLLSVFSNQFIGTIAGSVILLIATVLSGSGEQVFFLYFVSGIFSILIFGVIQDEINFVLPTFLTDLCLLVCLIGGILLTTNSKLSLELLLLPAANLIITSLIIFGGIRLYYRKILFRYRALFLYLNDTEHPALVSLRERNRKEYLQSIHTAHFCEKIGTTLNLDVDVLKCAGYYHRLCPLNENNRLEFYNEMEMPLKVKGLLDEYFEHILSGRKKKIKSQEGIVLLCSITVIMAILSIYEKNPGMAFDSTKIVEASFKKLNEAGAFDESEVSLYNLNVIKQIFIDEKLYYDFLR